MLYTLTSWLVVAKKSSTLESRDSPLSTTISLTQYDCIHSFTHSIKPYRFSQGPAVKRPGPYFQIPFTTVIASHNSRGHNSLCSLCAMSSLHSHIPEQAFENISKSPQKKMENQDLQWEDFCLQVFHIFTEISDGCQIFHCQIFFQHLFSSWYVRYDFSRKIA